MVVAEYNRDGGINGHPVFLDVHDDLDISEKAQDVAYGVGQRSPAVAVIGHSGSQTSLAAAPIYARFEIPAVSASATHDALTATGWYFRTVFNDSFQARFIGRYARFILNKDQGVVVAGSDSYGGQLAEAVGKAAVDVGLNVRRRWTLSHDDRNANGEAFDQLAAFLKGDGRDAVVFLMAREAEAKDTLIALKDRGVANAIIGPDVLGRPSFAEKFADLPKERQAPGFYTGGLFVTMPLIYDIASAQALAFKERFEQIYGYTPPWEAAFAYDAAGLVLTAAREEKVLGGADAARRGRAAIREHLAGMNAPERAFNGIAGPVYFEGGGDPKKPISMAMFQNGIIAPLSQLTQITNPNGVRDLETRLETGEIVRFEDQFMYRNSIVYTGLRPTGAWAMDVERGQFTAEFDLWFRYQGELPVADTVFPNAAGEVSLGEPIKAYSAQGVNYRLHHVKGTFQLDGAGRENRFDHHFAAISFRHRHLTSERLIYVPDAMVLPKSNVALTKALAKNGFLTRGDAWKLEQAWIFSDRLAAESLGEPDFIDASVERFPFSIFTLGLDVAEGGTQIRRSVQVDNPSWAVGGLALGLMVLLTVDRFIRHHFYSKLMFLAWGTAAFALLYVTEIALVDDWLAHWERARLAQLVQIIDVLFWLIPAKLLNTFLERFVWGEVERVFRRAVPRVVRSTTAFGVYVMALVGIVAFVFHQPVTLVLAAMGLAVTIIGFAVHRNIASVFAGIAFNFERAFAVGDWVRINGQGEGRVLDMSWRATKLRTAENHVLSIPNTVISESVIDRPEALDGVTREWIEVMIDPAVEPARVRKVLADAAMLVRKGDGFPIEAEVRFVGIDDWSARYRLYFSVTSFERREEVLEQIWIRVRTGLNLARIRPAMDGRPDPLGVPMLTSVVLTPRDLLSRIPFLAPFTDAELTQLAGQVREVTVSAGDDIVRQGDSGDSLFIIAEGVTSITVRFQDKDPMEVARLGPADFFGEMALLAGDPRSATVTAMTWGRVFEVTKDSIAPIIAQRRELLDAVVVVVEERLRANSQAKSRSDSAGERKSLSARISRFLFA
jgi:potassium efflux system protein